MAIACIMQKRKDLTGMDGHLVLLEYMEESPLLIGYPGEVLLNEHNSPLCSKFDVLFQQNKYSTGAFSWSSAFLIINISAAGSWLLITEVI